MHGWVRDLQLEKAKADRILREHGGDVVAALSFLVNEWPQDLVKGEAGRIDSESYLQPVRFQRLITGL
jgi:hypothetical protein